MPQPLLHHLANARFTSRDCFFFKFPFKEEHSHVSVARSIGYGESDCLYSKCGLVLSTEGAEGHPLLYYMTPFHSLSQCNLAVTYDSLTTFWSRACAHFDHFVGKDHSYGDRTAQKCQSVKIDII